MKGLRVVIQFREMFESTDQAPRGLGLLLADHSPICDARSSWPAGFIVLLLPGEGFIVGCRPVQNLAKLTSENQLQCAPPPEMGRPIDSAPERYPTIGQKVPHRPRFAPETVTWDAGAIDAFIAGAIVNIEVELDVFFCAHQKWTQNTSHEEPMPSLNRGLQWLVAAYSIVTRFGAILTCPILLKHPNAANVR